MREIDEIDWKILRELQLNARLTNADLAKRVALSPSPCWNRVRRLAAAGVIEKYVTIINQRAIGMPDSVILDAKLEQHDDETLKRFSDSPCTAWARRGTSACTNAGGPMQAYSMDLRERALLDSDAGMKAADVAVKYRVSGSWVRLLKQRRRETGDVAPRVQRHGRRRILESHLHTLAALIAEQPDRTLAELKDALGTPASLATIWRAVAALDVTVKKNGPALRTRST